ncbi:membrane protein insertion efficiency factor YidD [Aurantibacter crassamenti]|uniref:membrane protein insertion efficiency factor YidD n=1 Tax=Aurantibacter crassamenti TaxID=1837375 RepID=UPI0019395776|nr:membrane protein insertion efficiency factor YidD [Aurantibacter crassamenti]
MKILFLFCIKMYWFLIPENKRKKCLFKKSCSQYVFDITKENGIIGGVKALYFRFKHCRSGYYIINGEAGKLLISARNEVFDTNEINERILKNE